MLTHTYIYTISDHLGNIRYVGKSNNPKQRLNSHIQDKKRKHKFNWLNSIIKSGNKPIIEVIDIVSINDWEYWETYWISQVSSWGFNLINKTSGGEGAKSYKHSIESKNKMRLNRLGSKTSNETKEKQSNKTKEFHKNNPNFNKVLDRKIILSYEYLYNLYIIQNLSMPQISKATNISETTIYRNLNNFSIKKDKTIWSKQCKNNRVFIKKEKVIKEKTKVLQFDLNSNLIQIFNSIKEASELTNINRDNIWACCVGERKSSCGYIWIYEGEEIPSKYTTKTSRPIIQYDLYMNLINEFVSISQAARETNSKANCIQMCCSGKYKSSNNYIWRYKDNI